MTSISLALPQSLQAYIDELLANGAYSSIDEYILELIQQDHAQQQLETALTESLQSGESTPMTSDDWHTIRSAVQQRLQQPRSDQQ